MAGNYDVVSLFHCLEHTPDLRSDLGRPRIWPSRRAACWSSRYPIRSAVLGRVLRRLWLPWLQPQHLHFLSIANLTRVLRELGFEPLQVDRKLAHLHNDMACFS